MVGRQDGEMGVDCPQGVLFWGQLVGPVVERCTGVTMVAEQQQPQQQQRTVLDPFSCFHRERHCCAIRPSSTLLMVDHA